MKKREFNKIIRSVTSFGAIDKKKASDLQNDVKKRIVMFLVKNREPIFEPFITEDLDMDWIHSCGYLYWETGKLGKFLCTCEHQIK